MEHRMAERRRGEEMHSVSLTHGFNGEHVGSNCLFVQTLEDRKLSVRNRRPSLGLLPSAPASNLRWRLPASASYSPSHPSPYFFAWRRSSECLLTHSGPTDLHSYRLRVAALRGGVAARAGSAAHISEPLFAAKNRLFRKQIRSKCVELAGE